jgi:hypothetical protein
LDNWVIRFRLSLYGYFSIGVGRSYDFKDNKKMIRGQYVFNYPHTRLNPFTVTQLKSTGRIKRRRKNRENLEKLNVKGNYNVNNTLDDNDRNDGVDVDVGVVHGDESDDDDSPSVKNTNPFHAADYLIDWSEDQTEVIYGSSHSPSICNIFLDIPHCSQSLMIGVKVSQYI